MRENNEHLFFLKLKGLDKNKFYKCQSTGEVYSGGLLMNSGIYLAPLKYTGDSLVMHFVAVE